jgi:hypothetical protein
MISILGDERGSQQQQQQQQRKKPLAPRWSTMTMMTKAFQDYVGLKLEPKVSFIATTALSKAQNLLAIASTHFALHSL